MAIPTNHAQRYLLNNEVHARPYEALRAPERLSHLVLLPGNGERQADLEAITELCTRHNAPPPAPDATHYSADFGPFRVRWERHAEFVSYTFMVAGPFDDPFSLPALERVPHDWLSALPGQILVCAHAGLQSAQENAPEAAEIAQRHFNGNTLIGAAISGGSARAYTDFRIHADGFSRFLVCDISLGSRQAGRILQRLFEIDTYRMMGLTGLPLARDTAIRLAEAENRLVEINNAMCQAKEEDEPELLDRISRLAAEVENGIAVTQYRFDASVAYFGLMNRRIEELREERIRGLQTYREFMDRRLVPAMNTCESAALRQLRLSERISQTSQLLSTRVDITRERQNQQLLTSMNRRTKLQLRLQQAVEGLSVVAITYYSVGLIGYLAKAAKGFGLDIHPDLIAGLSIPVVALIVTFGVHHLKRKATQ
ncbi:MAG: DUF3422 domain-containing protein [Sulfuricella sp.]|nr:DUF3422 domain-containing protein [Sulfuricella sp.]